jgi:hypothetical protein
MSYQDITTNQLIIIITHNHPPRQGRRPTWYSIRNFELSSYRSRPCPYRSHLPSCLHPPLRLNFIYASFARTGLSYPS